MTSRFKKICFSILFAYIYLMMALTMKTDYVVISPYDTRSTYEMIQIDGLNLTSNLHSVSVMSMDNITPFGRMIYEMNKKLSIEVMNPLLNDLSKQEKNKRGVLQKQAAFEQSLISAYTLANNENSEITIDYDFTGLIIDFRQAKFSNLKIGDIITKINGIEFTNYMDMLKSFKELDDLSLTVKRNSEIHLVNITKTNKDVFSFYPKYDIKSTTPSHDLPGNSIPTGGPSGGMMYTLALYFNLIGFNGINEVVVGTGTINADHSIGKIGGLEQKVYTAIDKGIKYFIMPKSQYEEVVHLNDQIMMYQVSNIQEAIEVIYEIFR